jgi:outer membrane protein assembly factor BamB
LRKIMTGSKVALWLFVVAALLTGCGRAALPTSWPGLTVAEDVVYLAAGAKVYTLDAETGNQKWEFPTEEKKGLFYGTPAVEEGLVFVGSNDNNLYALDAVTGNQRWAFAAKRPIIAGPTVAGDTVYVGSADYKVYALEAATGVGRWDFAAGSRRQGLRRFHGS